MRRSCALARACALALIGWLIAGAAFAAPDCIHDPTSCVIKVPKGTKFKEGPIFPTIAYQFAGCLSVELQTAAAQSLQSRLQKPTNFRFSCAAGVQTIAGYQNGIDSPPVCKDPCVPLPDPLGAGIAQTHLLRPGETFAIEYSEGFLSEQAYAGWQAQPKVVNAGKVTLKNFSFALVQPSGARSVVSGTYDVPTIFLPDVDFVVTQTDQYGTELGFLTCKTSNNIDKDTGFYDVLGIVTSALFPQTLGSPLIAESALKNSASADPPQSAGCRLLTAFPKQMMGYALSYSQIEVAGGITAGGQYNAGSDSRIGTVSSGLGSSGPPRNSQGGAPEGGDNLVKCTAADNPRGPTCQHVHGVVKTTHLNPGTK
jgi:hypothetical protein